MSDFFQEAPAAIKWADDAEQRHQAGKFGEIVRGQKGSFSGAYETRDASSTHGC
ncbi:hypothetical protein [Pseudomonas sp. NFACC04-2]|uniref:hypothetical protein n=1 Tax=Pseudomonas sp. NFACC04-2 TaxID=1566242 RepID=UPI00147F85BA|nr:hypothetical protein [Pseudomonas sp. NFACC04-2]